MLHKRAAKVHHQPYTAQNIKALTFETHTSPYLLEFFKALRTVLVQADEGQRNEVNVDGLTRKLLGLIGFELGDFGVCSKSLILRLGELECKSKADLLVVQKTDTTESIVITVEDKDAANTNLGIYQTLAEMVAAIQYNDAKHTADSNGRRQQEVMFGLRIVGDEVTFLKITMMQNQMDALLAARKPKQPIPAVIFPRGGAGLSLAVPETRDKIIEHLSLLKNHLEQ